MWIEIMWTTYYVFIVKVSDHSYVVLVNLVYRTSARIGILASVSTFVFLFINALPKINASNSQSLTLWLFFLQYAQNRTWPWYSRFILYMLVISSRFSKIHVRWATGVTEALVRVVTHFIKFITFNAFLFI